MVPFCTAFCEIVGVCRAYCSNKRLPKSVPILLFIIWDGLSAMVAVLEAPGAPTLEYHNVYKSFKEKRGYSTCRG